jgi:hypothetical protein
MPWEIASRLLQQGIHSGSRSTVVTMLGWMAATLASCMIATVTFHAPDWMQVFVAVMFGADFATFLGTHIYFALVNPDALRSERFSIQKMAIQHRLVGDSVSGLFDIREGAQLNENGHAALIEDKK